MPDVPGGFHRPNRLAAGSSCLHAKNPATRPTVNVCGVRLRCALPGCAVLWYHGSRLLVKPDTGLKPDRAKGAIGVSSQALTLGRKRLMNFDDQSR
jgi:hypothetical protein